MTGFHIFLFTLYLKKPVLVAGKRLGNRTGFIIALSDENGVTGIGEAAPLFSLDRVDFLQCLEETGKLRKFVAASGISPGPPDLAAPFFGLLKPPFSINPITAFGFESALLHLLAASGRLSGALRPNPSDQRIPIRVNGLFIPKASKKDSLAQFDYLSDSGFSTVKVKIGRLDPKVEIRRIKELWDHFEGGIRLRLDANRSLSLEQYVEYYKALGAMNVEYVEEPLGGDDGLWRALAVPWPLALDESLHDYQEPEQLPKGVSAVILKPGSFWGVSGMVRAMDAFAGNGIKSVLSSSYNTGVGVCGLGLIARLGAQGAAHGLDTLKYLQKDVLPESPRIEKGRLVLPQAYILGHATMFHGNVPELGA